MTIRKSQHGYLPDVCPACHQSCTYLIEVNEHITALMIRISKLVDAKGINIFNPAQELESSKSWVSKAKLIGFISKDGRNYKISSLGLSFLKGDPVPRYTVVSKALRREVGHFNPDVLTCAISDFRPFPVEWSGLRFDLINNDVVRHQPTLV